MSDPVESNEGAVAGSSPVPCSACRYVYVVATGGYRFPVESDIPLSLHSAFRAALPRFASLGCNLGQIVEIKECSDDADAGNPHYIDTISALKMIGKFHEPNTQPSRPADNA